MSAGHTPGPWHADAINSWNVWARDCKVAATYGLTQGPQYREPPQEERIANARLVAAAPELLDALDGLIDGFPLPATVNEYELVQAGCDPTEARKIAAAVAAIAKARGQS